MRDTAQQGVKAISAAVDLIRTPASGVVVLIYHRVGGAIGAVNLDPSVFEDQIALIAEEASPLTMDQAAQRLKRAGPTDQQVVITFDDGTEDFIEGALPVLVKHRVPALLYIATKYVDEGRRFPGSGLALSWKALAEATSTGLVDIGSHTHSHRLLDRVTANEAADELDRSIDLIGEKLGIRPDHFAYPKALGSTGATEREVKRRFQTAAVAGGVANVAGKTDLHRLKRTPIQAADTPRWFTRKLVGGMAFEDQLRARINRVRYTDSVR